MLQRWFGGFRVPTPARAPFTATCTVEGGLRFSKKRSFEVLLFQWGVAPTQQPRPKEAGKSWNPGVSDFSVVKRLDDASPELSQAVTSGERIGKVEVIVTNGSTTSVYRFGTVLAIGYRAGGGGGDEHPLEEVTFEFQSFSHTSKP